jgi:hypothetical protein
MREKLPGVLILPAWKGIDDEAKTAALNLKNKATLLLLQIFMGKEKFLPIMISCEKFRILQENYEEYQKRISLALEQLKKNGAISDKIAIGYCLAERELWNLPEEICLLQGLFLFMEAWEEIKAEKMKN